MDNSLYNKRQVDCLIAAYFTEACSDETRIKIYCYIAACGLLWSNWCEYSIHDAIEAGFNHVVFIIRKDIEKEFKEVIGDRIASICFSHNVTVDYLGTFQISDLTYNTLGGAVGGVIYYLGYCRKRKNKTKNRGQLSEH